MSRFDSTALCRLFLVTLLVGGTTVSCARKASPSSTPFASPATSLAAPSASTFVQARAAYRTHLVAHHPSPQDFDPWDSMGADRVVTYRSGELALKGIYVRATNDKLRSAKGHPMFVFLHSGAALGADDQVACKPALEAGFAVFTPALRGENGNPGDYEIQYGELDDARAAVAFAATLPDVDPSRVVVFGHSAGGILSALMSLYPDTPAVDLGSVGGIYDERMFVGRPLPFEDSKEERHLRLFGPHVAELAKPHFACMGRDDQLVMTATVPVAKAATAAGVPLEVKVVDGDHLSSADACLRAFVDRVLPKVR